MGMENSKFTARIEEYADRGAGSHGAELSGELGVNKMNRNRILPFIILSAIFVLC